MRRCVSWQTVYSPAIGGNVRRCARFSGTLAGLSGVGQVGTLGQAGTLRGTFDEIKDVLYTGLIATGGALLTDQVFNLFASSWVDASGNPVLVGWKRHLAEAATGIGLGVLVGRLLKRPRLGAMLAIGPVVFAGVRMLGELLNMGPMALPVSPTAGLGRVAIEPYQPYPLMSGETPSQLGAWQVGPGTPSFMLQPQQPPAYAGAIGY